MIHVLVAAIAKSPALVVAVISALPDLVRAVGSLFKKKDKECEKK